MTIAGLALVVGGALAAGWWLAGGEATAVREASSVVLPRESAAPTPATRPDALPIAEPSHARPLAEPEVAFDPASGGADGSAADDPTAHLPGDAARFTGRVVDEAGRPVAGALVTHVPSQAARSRLKIYINSYYPDFPRETFRSTRSGDDGRFVLPTREITPANVAPVDGRRGEFAGKSFPALVVEGEGLRCTVETLWGFTGGDHDAGDIVTSTGGALSGRVIDESGTPVAGAIVHPAWTDENGGMVLESTGGWMLARFALRATSDAQGRFLLDGLWPPQVELSVTADGFVPTRELRSVVPGPPRSVGEIVLSRGDSISGWVLGPGDVALPGVEVLVRWWSGHHIIQGEDATAIAFGLRVRSNGREDVRTVADAQGRFAVSSLTQPEYLVYAGGSGFEPAVSAPTPVGNSDVVLRLIPQALIVLRVVDAGTDALVHGATVKGRRLGGLDGPGALHYGLLTVRQGAEAAAALDLAATEPNLFLLGNVGRVRSLIFVEAPGYATQGFIVDGIEPPERAQRTVKLKREAVLAGRVTDLDGRGLPRARVRAKPPSSLRVELDERVVTADGEGAFRLEALLPGAWELRAEASAHVPGEWVEAAVALGKTRDDIVLVLQPGGRITGRVVNRAGEPQRGLGVNAQRTEAITAQVSTALAAGVAAATPATGSHRATATANDDGRFVLEGLVSGDWRVSAGLGADQLVRVTAPEAVDVLLVTREAPVVRGRVRRAGQPVAGVSVRSSVRYPGPGGWVSDASTSTSDLGEYELVLDGPGRYALQVGANNDRSTFALVDADWDHVEYADLEMGSGRIAGLVVQADGGAPIEGLRLLVQNLTQQEAAAAQDFAGVLAGKVVRTDADGRFVADGCLPGRWRVEPWQEEDQGWSVDATETTIAPGAVVDDLRIALLKQGP